MIICSCNVITEKEIKHAIASLRAKASYDLITPRLVYRELGYNPICGTCLNKVVELIIETEQSKSA